MLNTHLHIVLQYNPGKGQRPRTLSNVVFAFLSSRVQYGENATGLLTYRCNGQAQIEADSSIDNIGYTEAALFGARQGLRRIIRCSIVQM